MLARARLLAALLALAVATCTYGRNTRHSEPTAISRHHLIDLQWRLTSAVFPVMPLDGFPVSFHSDGGIETQNLGRVNRWTFSNDLLRLYHDEQGLLYFRWLPTHGVFRSCSDPARPPLFVFPVGKSAMDVQEIGCEHSPSAADPRLQRTVRYAARH